MNIYLGLIIIGNCNWKRVITDLWNSTKIDDRGYYFKRAKEEFEYKLTMSNKELPSYMTNCDLHVMGNYLLRVAISMPVISNYTYKNDKVKLPWYDKETEYSEASKVCSKSIIDSCNHILILCVKVLSNEEKEFMDKILGYCVTKNKRYMIINDNQRFYFDMLFRFKWIDSDKYCMNKIV